jgi:hypothetical protein
MFLLLKWAKISKNNQLAKKFYTKYFKVQYLYPKYFPRSVINEFFMRKCLLQVTSFFPGKRKVVLRWFAVPCQEVVLAPPF